MGKQQNPLNGSGGMLLGTVKEIGPKLKDRDLKVGDRIATLVSLSLTPLKVDEIISIGDDEALDAMKDLVMKEGLLAGISSGAAIAAVCKVLKRKQFTGKTIVTLLPDTAERYLMTYGL